MKLKGKLILSCAALAAVATTAFSTTYAWYTSNVTVKATGLKAGTDSAANSALQISLNGTEWGASVSLDKIKQNLTPVQRLAGDTGVVGTYKIQNMSGTTNPVAVDNTETTDDDESAAKATDNIVQFDLYFRNVSMADNTTCPVYVKTATVTNNHPGGVATKLLADLSTGTDGYTQAKYSSYKIDLLRALDVEIVAAYNTNPITASSGVAKIDWSSALDSAKTGQKTSAFTLESFANMNGSTALTGTDKDNFVTGMDALAYYNTVKGLTTDTDKAKRPAGYLSTDETSATGYNAKYLAPTTDFSSIFNGKGEDWIGQIPSNKQILKTTWTFYLDGWDKACFDACKGQQISFDFTFTSEAAK